MSYSGKPWLKFYHPNVSEYLELERKSLTKLLLESVESYGDQTALTFYGQTWTFQDVYQKSERFAARLHEEGFQKGDRLAIMLPNTPHYIFSIFGALRLGGIVVQVNPMYVEREIEYVLNDSGAEFMVVFDALYPRVKNVRSKTSLKKIIVVSLGNQTTDLDNGDFRFEEFLPSSAAQAPNVDIDPDEDVAFLQYTGGTTGVSKGVMLTHFNIAANIEQMYAFSYQTIDDMPENPKVMSILPMFHIYGLTCNVFMGFRAGLNQIILPRFDVEEVLQTVKREKPFQFGGVPTMYIALNNHPDLENYGFDQIRFYNSGGAAMPVEQLHLFEKRTHCNLCEGYGLSETSPVTHFNPLFLVRRPGSIGIPVPHTEVKIVKETDKGIEEVPVGEVGELMIKGPQVMKGYWNKPEETKAVLKDGWLFTGDLARMDNDGYFYIVDRKKDMIIASGYNVYPREVEEVLYQHPAVKEVIVIGVPDEYRGETVKAYITLKEDQQATEEELIEFSRQFLAPYKAPRMIEFREQLPRSAVGKLLRRVLRDEEMKKNP
ncbi:long-chain-fatty-acid--CoA ligase [Lihuaxuella thermophila]|uniref:Long-chain acyl-CoA synthetase n=1 Tax=Lihuaxuella thermophila TaxID=1173111 RepID=A0A1H8CAU2_9BACL|nr:long-chain fatty acid--CoA ligase [Lihuaxuella thermophila]SEM91554.1 long-chain acyl-CoA synthetase [Lihuaxuella thermophila]